MAVDNEAFCSVIDAFTPPFCVTLPGGGEICYQGIPGEIPISPNVCKDLLGQLNVALAGLAPIMCIIDIALAIINVLKAIPDAIGPPPDPSAITTALLDLADAAACLLPMIPQLSICPLIKALLDLIVSCLQDIIKQIENLIVLEARTLSAEEILTLLESGNKVGLDLTGARDYLNCANANRDLLLEALDGGTESIQRMLDITVNPLMEIAQLDPIVFEDMNLGDFDVVQEALQPLRDLIVLLTDIRDALPCDLLTFPPNTLPPEQPPS